MNEFRNHLKSYLSDKEVDKLIDSFNEESKHGVLLNTHKMDDNKFLQLYPNVVKHPFVPHAFIYNKNEYELGKTIYHELGCFYLQEPSAMMVSYLLNPCQDDVVLDLCAAPGGKTIQAALLMKNKGVIISNDLSKDRCRILSDNISRLGINNCIVTNNDFSLISKKYQNYFDKIIIDAPCSGSGMFRKEDKMKEDWSVNKVFKNSMIQIELIHLAYNMLKPGGTMVYSTCSYSYEEDESVVKSLLDNSDARVVNINDSNLFYKSDSKIGIHLFPHLFPGEGHYICLIEKPGLLKKGPLEITNNFSKFIPEQIQKTSIVKFGNILHSLPCSIKYKGINIYSYGTEIGEIFNNNIVYSYPLAHLLENYNQVIDLNENETQRYLLGEQLNKSNPYIGNVLLTYENIPIDFSKTNGAIIKNHYPKYLRKKVIFR